MAINREYIKSKVRMAIEQLPSAGIVVREVYNKHHEKTGYCTVAELRGVLYNNSSSRDLGISINNNGVNTDTNNKNFLVVYDEKSKEIRDTDIIFVDGEVYKVSDLGENLQIYCLMQLKEHHTLKIDGDTVIEDDNIYPLFNLPLELNLTF